jgi:hypothetical protein
LINDEDKFNLETPPDKLNLENSLMIYDDKEFFIVFYKEESKTKNLNWLIDHASIR